MMKAHNHIAVQFVPFFLFFFSKKQHAHNISSLSCLGFFNFTPTEMDATASAAHANLLEPNVLELIHQLEVWYTTALQQQGDESGHVAQGLLTRLKTTTSTTSSNRSTTTAAASKESAESPSHIFFAALNLPQPEGANSNNNNSTSR
jgi:hypothetical protein